MQRNEENTHKKVIPEPLIVWDKSDNNSITAYNHGQNLYEKQNKYLSLNTFHELNIARANHLDNDIIVEEICDIMLSLYYHFLCTIEERPEFI